jgi:hypothetical protein
VENPPTVLQDFATLISAADNALTAADPANKDYRIWHSVVVPDEMSPANPDELRRSFLTKRKKDVIEFEFLGTEKNCFMAVQIENKGKKDPWGPLTQALTP